MIALDASALGGPIQMVIGGCLGGSGLGTGSHSWDARRLRSLVAIGRSLISRA